MPLQDLQQLLMPYQKSWVCDPSRYKIAEKGRQLGFSWIEALWSVSRRILKRIDHLFCSTNEDTAKEFIRYCREWANVFNVILNQTEIIIEDQKAECLEFCNGARIIALSSKPISQRGFTGDITLDEFAHSQCQEALYTAASPVTTWNEGHLHIISSHNGTGTLFFQLCEQARLGFSNFKLHKVTLYDAVRQGLALRVPGDHRKFLPDVRRCNTEYIKHVRSTCFSDAQFKQEYLAEPLSAESLIKEFHYDRLNKVYVPEELDYSKTYGELLLGCDVAIVVDLTSIWVAERSNNPNTTSQHDRYWYHCVAHKVIHNQDIPTQYVQLKAMLAHPAMVKAFIDQGGNGRALVDAAVNDFGGLIEPFNFTNPSKARIAERVSGFVSQGRIDVPLSSNIMDDVKLDLCALRRVISARGLVTYEGRSKRSDGVISHCDVFWSLALCLEAGVTTEGAFSYYIPTDKNRSEELKKLDKHPTVAAIERMCEDKILVPSRDGEAQWHGN